MTRRQLSLFASGTDGDRIERVRRVVDPVQAALIPAHVTLCREDEIQNANVELLAQRIGSAAAICLSFDKVERFSGHGIWLRSAQGQPSFDALRRHVLGLAEIRDAVAHLTLAHPRNPRASGNSIENVNLVLPISLVFDRVTLVEQLAAGQNWIASAVFHFSNGKQAGSVPVGGGFSG
jgi:hypothetical protein